MRLLSFIILLISGLPSIGQQVLYLEQPGRFKRKEIEYGQACVWEIDGLQWIPSKLEKVRDTLVYIADDSVSISRITGIKIQRNPRNINMFRKAFLSVTVFYPLMVTLSGGIKELQGRWKEVVIVAGSAYLLNHLLKVWYVKNIPLDRSRYRLVIRERI